MAFVGVAECYSGIGETEVAHALLESARVLATAMVNEEKSSSRDTGRWYDPPFGLRVFWTLPHLFIEAGNIEQARDIMKQAMSAAQRLHAPIRNHTGLGFPPGMTVGHLARQGPVHLVKEIAEEILLEEELETALWVAADILLNEGQFEEALILLEDGHIAPRGPRHEIVWVLTKAAEDLIRSKQLVRAQQISDLAMTYALENFADPSVASLLGGIAAGLGRSKLPEAAQAVVDLALKSSRSLRQPHRWTPFRDFVETILEVCTPAQACQLAQWIIEAADRERESMQVDDYSGRCEEWIGLIGLAAKAYATAGKIDHAVATANRIADEYGREQNYLYTLGVVYTRSKKRGRSKRRAVLRQEIQDLATDLLASAKWILSYDGYSENGNGMITDVLVTLARLGEVAQAIEEAKKIEYSYYRILCLATILHDTAPGEKRGVHVDIAQKTLAVALSLVDPIKHALCSKTIKALARNGRIDLAEKAIREVWFLNESGEMVIDESGKVIQVNDMGEFRHWEQRVALAQVLAEMTSCGSSWSSYVIAELFLKKYFHIWDLAAVAPAFGVMGSANDLWQRVQKLLLTQQQVSSLR